MTDSPTTPDARRAYLAEMIRKRGYVLDAHKVLVAEDLPFMKGVNGLLEAAYIEERALDKKTKELLFTVLMTASGAPSSLIALHARLARDAGASKAEVLEAIELVALPCGLPAFFRAQEAWAETFEVERIEPE